MKKILCLVLAAMFCLFAFASCSAKEDKLVIGYTIYEPMNYTDDSGKLIGFDTELAEAVAKKLDMEIEFQLIEWSKKYQELDAGTVTCLWNGFTSNCADDDGVQRSDKVDFSYAYMKNEQCVVIRTEDAATLNSKDALAGKKGAAEDGSAGETVVKDFIGENGEYIGCTAQTATLTELMGKKVDFVVIDKTMAKTLIGQGDYASLSMVDTIEIASEEYSIGFKKGSELTAKVNEALKELAADGTMMELAKKYGLENYVITDFN
ncbi:MAG: transporter substrate-binding domain-containing protein [Clostridia bacterium]|nr:transporter substrate-binding domain-containing protein [Clostridia bacterium]